MTSDAKTKKYLTTDEVSARFGGRIKAQTLANWRNIGTGPAFTKLGRKVLYPEDKLVEWEASNTVNSTSEYAKTRS